MSYIPIEDIWKVADNKYQAIVLASREARRINRVEKENEETGEKPTLLALKRLVGRELNYRKEKEG